MAQEAPYQELEPSAQPSITKYVVGGVSGIAVVLVAGYVFFSSGGTPDDTHQDSTLVLMRHCARGCQNKGYFKTLGVDGKLQRGDADMFSSQKWPNSVPDSLDCLPRGEQLVKAQGSWMKASGGLPAPLRVLSDTIGRDTSTAAAFLQGYGESDAEVKKNGDVFMEHFTNPMCFMSADGASMMESAEALQAANPQTPEYKRSEQELFDALGAGSAGDWTKDGCKLLPMGAIKLPYPVGACQVASALWERLMMQWAGGYPLGFGKVNASQVIKWNVLHSWYMALGWSAPETFKIFGASMARTVAEKLMSSPEGTDFLLGHDTNMLMLAGALGLSWDPKPYAVKATTPGSMLRFDRQGANVKASFYYVKDFSSDDGEMASVPGTFESTGTDTISMETFKRMLYDGSNEHCSIDPSELP